METREERKRMKELMKEMKDRNEQRIAKNARVNHMRFLQLDKYADVVKIMETNEQTYSKQPNVETPAKFIIKDGTEPTTIVSRLYGPGTNEEVLTQLQRDGLSIPTLGHYVSYALLAKLYPENPDLEEMNKIMREKYVNSGTDVHRFLINRIGDEIVFYRDITHLNQRLRNPTLRKLEEMLSSRESRGVVYSEDGTLRRVQGRYPDGELQWGTLRTNPHIIGMTGSEECAEEADALALLYEDEPCFYLPKSTIGSNTAFSTLNSNRDSGMYSNYRLGFGGGYRGYYGDGFALGVQEKTGETSRA